MVDSTFNKIKAGLFPTITTILGLLIWTQLRDLQADVKLLLANSNIQATKIENLERQVFGDRVPLPKQEPPVDHKPLFTQLVFTKQDDHYEVKKELEVL